jgi:hypothetical protein
MKPRTSRSKVPLLVEGCGHVRGPDMTIKARTQMKIWTSRSRVPFLVIGYGHVRGPDMMTKARTWV